MQYPSYEKQQPTELEWVVAYPAHWSKKRFKFLLKDGYEGLKIGPFGSQIKSEDLSNDGYKIYGQENIINRNFKIGDRYLDEDKFQELTVYEIFPGDLLITMMGTSGKCEIAPGDLKQGIMDSHLIRLRTNSELFVVFARYLIDQSNYVEYQIRQLGKGSIMHGLNSTVIKNLEFLLPPIEEQYSIVKFLNYKTQQLDQLIKKKKTLIEKLNEQRVAVITQAVTKGLDKNVKMKSSGVDWLGDIPKHWAVVPIKRKFKIVNGATPKSSEPLYWDGDILWVTPADFSNNNNGYITDTTRMISTEGFESCGTTLVPENSIIITTRAPIGAIALAKKEMCTNQGCKSLVKDSENIFERFIYYALSVSGSQLNALGLGTTFMELSKDTLGYYSIALPTIDEQKEIVSYLSRSLKRLDKLSRLAQDVIEKLEEYRASLITDVVTGKIDVRNIELREVAE